MYEIKGNLSNAFGFRFIKIIFLGKLLLMVIGVNAILPIILFLIITTPFYIALTNNDFKFFRDRVEISPSVLNFRKTKKIEYKKITKVIVKHEAREHPIKEWLMCIVFLFIPMIEYKWVKIITAERTYTFFCFGLEYDYYDNHDDILMEDLFNAFAGRVPNTSWTKTDDPYFTSMNPNRQ